MKPIQRIPMFYRHLLSYIVLLFIPIILMGAFVYQHFESVLKIELISKYEGMMGQVRDELDTKFREMNNIAYDISINPELKPTLLSMNMSNAIQAKKYLNFAAGNNFLQDVALYFKQLPYMYSSTTTYSPERFVDDYYDYENWDEKQFVHDLEHLKKPLLRPAEPVHTHVLPNARIITYAVPIPQSAIDPYGTVLFLIDEKTIQEMLRSLLKQNASNAAVYDKDGKLLTSIYDERFWPDRNKAEQALREIMQSSKDKHGAYETMVKGKQLLATRVASGTNGFTIVSLSPMEETLLPLKEAQLAALITLIAILVLGGALIYLLMRLNYRPLSGLVNILKSTGSHIRGWNDMQDVVQGLAHQTSLLRNQWQRSLPALREYWTLMLLKGSAALYALELDEQLQRCGLRFDSPMNGALKCMFRQKSGGSDAALRSAASELGGLISECTGAVCYGVPWENDDCYAFVCSVSVSEAQWHERLEQVLLEAEKRWNVEVTLGAGRLYEDIARTGRSFIEASTALDYRIIKGRGRLIPIHDVVQDEEERWYPNEELKALQQALLDGQADRVESMIRHVFRQMDHAHAPLYLIRCICYDISNTLIKSISQAPRQLQTIVETSALEAVAHVTKYDSLQELEHAVTRLASEICRRMASPEVSHNLSLAERMTQFIEDRFADGQFSLQMVADQFGVSASFLKKYYKEQTGCTIGEQVNRLRLNAAKRLLRESDLPVKDLIQQIGYSDTSSFIRKFKQSEGVTPGEYRKQYGR